MKQIIFAGGIHGVGKSTLCLDVASALSIKYLSASKVLKWEDLNADKKNKKVIDIPDTQSRLINGLKNLVEPGENYLLDGHFCLFNKDGEVTPVPMETFKEINPIVLILIINSISVIKDALETRDSKVYDGELLRLMQESEKRYANEVATNLNITLIIFDKQVNEINALIENIYESFA